MNTENLIKIGLFSDFFYSVTFFNQGLRFVTLRKDYGDHVVSTIFFYHTTCESTCDTLASSAANQGDNTVSVAQGGTATPGATEQLLPPDRVFKRNIYLCIHKIN